MSYYALTQVNKETYERICRNYFKFISKCNNPDEEPVDVFSPLPGKMLQELELIRDISKELQTKKIEEDRMAKEAEEEIKRKENKETENETVKEDAEENNSEENNTEEEKNTEEKND
ncbi:uncharacterized protein LOC128681759 isoform X1 [Plodia interpunctella]|uniref:uncharacterized protein LOC128681759 isoform X1 n=1 Tax=Plodia interpunctella TaxID=58824 RepID=UPI00236862E6|nr:uncharacterized protein LOC128681759 isoform X1 [Plodia interpunctella]